MDEFKPPFEMRVSSVVEEAMAFLEKDYGSVDVMNWWSDAKRAVVYLKYLEGYLK